MDTLKVTEGESVELQTAVSQLQSNEKIQWRYGPKDVVIAEINGKNNEISYNTNDEQFKDRLALDHQSGSLTITNIRSTDAGGYELHIKNKNTTSYKKFNVLVWCEYIKSVSSDRDLYISVRCSITFCFVVHTLKHTAGDSVTLHTGVCELTEDDRILWTFGDKNTTIAEINRAGGHVSVYEGNDERFRDRLKLNQQNGDLTITNISRGHSDVYNLQINNGADNKRFMLIAHGQLLKSFTVIGCLL